MSPSDRRGGAEIMAWIAGFALITIVLVACLFAENGKPLIWPLFGLFSGQAMALVARGTKGAIDRDAQQERNKGNEP